MTTAPFTFDTAAIMREAHAAARDLVARAQARHDREREAELGRAERGGYAPNLTDRRIAYRKALSMTLQSAWKRAHGAKASAEKSARLAALDAETKARIADLRRQVSDLQYTAIRVPTAAKRDALQAEIAQLEAA